MLIPNNKLQEWKERVTSIIAFDFGQGLTIIDWLANMKLYVSDVE